MSRKGIEHIVRSGWAVIVGLVFASCGGGSSTKDPGTLGGACYANGACNPGLECAAGICAPALASPDAAPVADAPLTEPDLPVATPDLPVAPAVDLAPDIVVKQDACVPACTNKACGADDGCGKRCNGTCAGGTCQNGYCCSCTAGQQCCQGTCTTLATDQLSCGLCGNACTAGMSCVGGACGICTPNCTAKTCGSNGCGGSCGTCAAGTACFGGTCTACTPNCLNATCGDDGCGGTCGKCAANQTCAGGTCTSCTANCTGKNCGEDDGCGGKCTGVCPGGGTCQSGICVGACLASCAGMECGYDGCGSSCGTCPYPQTCTGGKCVCKPWCTTRGLNCGSDGCGGTCGTCTGGQVCGELGTCVDDPAVIGCADSTREGFKDLKIYPTVASCQAAFAAQSLRVTRTGATCGNSLRQCTVPEDACAAGWHLCMKNGWAGDLTDRVSGVDCYSPVAGSASFVTGSSEYVAANNCTMPLPCNSIPSICCGAGCDKNSDTNYDDCAWADQTATHCVSNWGCTQSCGTASSTTDGVLCCKDPPVSGH
jgi:hypothetical protein